MSPVLQEVLVLVLGFVLLGAGANYLVGGGTAIARSFGIPHLVIGLTVVAWGTSMPEVVVAGVAAAEGKFGASLGTVLGSNVANIGLVIGASALILPAILVGRIQRRDGIMLFGSLALLHVLCFDRTVTRLDAGILLAVFLVYNLLLLRDARDDTLIEEQQIEHEVVEHKAEEELSEEAQRKAQKEAQEEAEIGAVWPAMCILLGSVAIALGAKLVMMSAENLAARAGVSEVVIALTLFALGTSLPELAAGIKSALDGHSDISFGNVIGSNVFNTLAVVGIAGMVRPFGFTAQEKSVFSEVLNRDILVNYGFAAALIALPLLTLRTGSRPWAALLLLAFAGYTAYLFSTGNI